MGIVFRQSIKSTLAVAIGTLLGIGINLAAPHLVPRIQLGFSRNLINQGTVLQFIALLGIHNAVTTFMPRYSTNDVHRKALITTSLLVPLVVFILLMPLYGIFRETITNFYQEQDRPLVTQFFWLLPGITALICAHSLMDGFMITEKKVALMMINREVILRLATLALLLLYGFSVISFTAFMNAHLLAYGLPVVLLFFLARRTGRYPLGFGYQGIARTTWIEWARFSWYHMLTGLALNLIGFLDALLLPALNSSGMESLALYIIAIFVAAILLIPFKALSQATFPVLNEAFIAGGTDKVRNLFDRSALNILLASVPLLILLLANLHFLKWLLPPEYADVGMLTAILLIGRFVEISTGLNTEMLSISSEYKFMFRISVALVVVLLLLNLYLIPRYGAAGAAWSASIAFILYNIAKVTRLYQRLHLFPYSKSSLKVLLAGVCTLPVFFLPQVGHPLLDLFVRSILIIIIYGIAIHRLRPSEDVQTFIREYLRKGRLL